MGFFPHFLTIIFLFLLYRSFAFSFLFSSSASVTSRYFQPTSCASRPSTANWGALGAQWGPKAPQTTQNPIKPP